MVNTVVVGPLGLDDIKTPFGSVQNVLGASASYSAYAASFFSQPGIVSIVGEDFPDEYLNTFTQRGIDVSGIQKVAGGKTLRWSGDYSYDLNVPKTLKTELNVIEDYEPKIPEQYRSAEFLCIGPMPPESQLSALRQMDKRPKLTICDTRDFYIKSEPQKVLDVIRETDIVLLNDSEARMLFNTNSLVKAAREILKLDSEVAIIKKGEHGAVLFTDTTHFSAPSYPLEEVVDPTGAGDCFAGALLGYMAKINEINEKNFRKAIIYASVIASFNVEGFSLNNLSSTTMDDIEKRYAEMQKIAEF